MPCVAFTARRLLSVSSDMPPLDLAALVGVDVPVALVPSIALGVDGVGARGRLVLYVSSCTA